MLDFSVTFNIKFTAVTGALLCFLLASFIAVAAKGKRKCNAFDVILRIVASLVFAASVVLVAAAVLELIPGNYKITVTDGSAALVFGASTFDLPLPELFAALSTLMGECIAGALFVLSLVALIVDCTVANKKKKRELKVTNSAKTPEQRRIAAEVAKIRAIGNSAVRRTSAAAESAESKDADKKEPTKPEEKTDEPAQVAAQETAPDWRSTPEKKQGFVGLENNADPDFDTFDSFDSFVGTDESAQNEIEEQATDEAPDYVDDIGDAIKHALDDLEEAVEELAEEHAQESDGESVDNEYAEEATEEIVDEATEEITEETVEETVQETDEYSEEVYDETEEVADEQEATNEDDVRFDEVTETANDTAAEPEQEPEELMDEEPDGYAPNRNIYIPRIRTIARRPEPQSEPAPAPKKKAESSAAKTAPASKPAAAKSGAAAKKATAKKQTSNAASKSQATSKKPSATPKRGEVPDGRKLPVNRRYVIIDRRSAVNMFGEYLRERDGDQKDKLKSSISTIILK